MVSMCTHGVAECCVETKVAAAPASNIVRHYVSWDESFTWMHDEGVPFSQGAALPELERTISSHHNMSEVRSNSVEAAIGSVALDFIRVLVQWLRLFKSTIQLPKVPPGQIQKSSGFRTQCHSAYRVLNFSMKGIAAALTLLVVLFGFPTDVDVFLTAGKEAHVVRTAAKVLSIMLGCGAMGMCAIFTGYSILHTRHTGHVVPVMDTGEPASGAGCSLSQGGSTGHSNNTGHCDLASCAIQSGTGELHVSMDDAKHPLVSGDGGVGALDQSRDSPELRPLMEFTPTESLPMPKCFKASISPPGDADNTSFAHVIYGSGRWDLQWEGCTDMRVMGFFKALKNVQWDARVQKVRERVGLIEGEAVNPLCSAVLRKRSAAFAKDSEGALAPYVLQVRLRIRCRNESSICHTATLMGTLQECVCPPACRNRIATCNMWLMSAVVCHPGWLVLNPCKSMQDLSLIHI